MPEFILTDNKFYPYNKFQTLIDAGFVNSPNGTISFSENTTMHFVGAEIKIDKINSSFGVSTYTLTDAGNQLLGLKSQAAEDDFLNKFKEVIEKNNRAKVVSIEHK